MAGIRKVRRNVEWCVGGDFSVLLDSVQVPRVNCPCPEQGRYPNSQLSSVISA